MNFETLYTQHRLQVFRWCLRYGGGSSVWAEDVTHDVFLKLFEALPGLGEHADLGGWLYRVTSHLALKRLARDRSFLERIVRWVQSPPPVAPADQLVERSQETAAALQAVESLPPSERVVVMMVLVDGTSQTEAARALGMSKGNVSKLMSRARATLTAAGWEGLDGEE